MQTLDDENSRPGTALAPSQGILQELFPERLQVIACIDKLLRPIVADHPHRLAQSPTKSGKDRLIVHLKNKGGASYALTGINAYDGPLFLGAGVI